MNSFKKKSNYILQTYTFVFKEDINQVFNCLFQPKILSKCGILGVLYDAHSVDKKNDTLINGIKVKYLKPLSSIVEISMEEIIDNPTDKIVTQKLVMINGKKVTSTVYLKFNLFLNTTSNYTILTFENEAESSNDPFLLEYIKSVPHTIKVLYCQKINCFLEHWKKRVISMESIVIDRPLNQILEFIPELKTLIESLDIGVVLKEIEGKIINKKQIKEETKNQNFIIKSLLKNNDKAIIQFKNIQKTSYSTNYINIAIIRLSPISCYVSLENDIPFYITRDIINFPQINQQILKKLKKILETRSCFNI